MLRADEPGEPVRRAEHERDGDDAATARREQRERREQQRQRRGELATVERLRVAEQSERQQHEVEQRVPCPYSSNEARASRSASSFAPPKKSG